ncbi:MAG: squalene/phytoene synthase family protein, partial [Planctomycetota bacterium]
MQTTLFVKTVETPSFQHEMECIQSAMDRGTKWNLAEAETYCRNWGRNQYENFTVVSLLLPKSVRQDFYNIYAYCRWSDNLADEIEEQQRSLQLLGDWESELRLCWGGQPKHPILVALQRTAQENRLSQENFLNLLSAFRQDRQLSRYGDAASLLDYCTRSA